LLARGIEQAYLAMCRRFLTGNHRPERPIPGTSFDANPLYPDRNWQLAYFDAVE
jgi:hypothetical protein